MKIDLTCPVELWQYSMPTEDDMECTFVMNNLSEKVVTSVQVTLACYDKEDMLLFRQTERIQGLKAGVGERFSILLLPSEWKDVDGVDLVVDKVWFDDATIWRRSNAPLTQYAPNALANGRALDQLRFVAGKDAVGYPQEQEQVWVCVCGRANALDSDRCCRCERRRESVFASFTKDNVDAFIAVHERKLDDVAKRAREENSALAESREKQRAVKRRRRVKAFRLALSGLCLLVVLAVVGIWGVPTIRYNLALEKLQHGDFDGARADFTSMGSYRDASEQLVACDYREAEAALAAGDEEGLNKAMTMFEALDNYAESKVKWQEAAYELGDLNIAQKKYDAAVGLFQSLGDYEDSATKASEATYLQAAAMLEGKDYTIAKVLFSGLGDYRDSAYQAMMCDYRQYKELFDAGDYAAALEPLTSLGDFEDAPSLAQQAAYRLGDERLAQSKLDEAGAYYQRAGDYEDAADKANDCLYQYAQQLRAAGDYEQAAKAFAKIAGYQDSEGQLTLCINQQAKALADAKDYANAAALLGTITGNDETTQLLNECNYNLATQAIDAGDDATAERLLENVDQYSDSERLLRTVRYRLAEALLADGSYQEALRRYEALDAYRDSRAKQNQCRYQLALALMTSGDYAAAAEAFAALGDYGDSKAQLAEATYQLALQNQQSGDTSAASDLLSTIPQHESAAQTLGALNLAEGQKLEAAGNYEAAAKLYAAAGDSAEAKARYNACQYALAKQLMQSGESARASAIFMSLGDYEDAVWYGATCAQSAYGHQAETAREAYAKGDYLTVAVTLDGMDMTLLPDSYQDLKKMYEDSCYQYAEQLYRDDKPYEALPFYERIPDYRDVTDKKLNRRAYLILGTWLSTTGKQATFRADGTCDLMGEELFFRVSNFSLFTGKTADAMTVTHKVSTIDQKSMSLRDVRDGKDVVYKLNRVEEEQAAAPTLAPLPTLAPSSAPTAALTGAPVATPTSDVEEMLVQEE